MKNHSKYYRVSFFLYFLLFALIIEFITVSIMYWFNYMGINSNIVHQYKSEQNRKISSLNATTDEILHSIDAINKSFALKNYIAKSNKNNKSQLQKLFLYVANEHKNIAKISYVNSNGIEEISINQDHSKSYILQQEFLKNISEQSFVDKIMRMRQEQFWYSNIELSKQDGKLQIPYIPILKIAKKVYNKQDHYSGFVMIDIYMKDFLKNFIGSPNFDIYLIDHLGNYIFSANNLTNWSLALKKDRNFKKDFDLEYIKKGAVSNGHTTIYFTNLSKHLLSSHKMFLAFVPRASNLMLILKNTLLSSIWVFVILMILSIPVAYFISHRLIKLYKRYSNFIDNLFQQNKILNKNLMSFTINRNGYIKSSSRAFAEKIGYTNSEIINKHYTYLHKYSNILVSEDTLQIPANKKVTLYAKDGHRLYLNQIVTPIYDEKKNTKEYFIVLFDATSQKQHLSSSLVHSNDDEIFQKILQREIDLADKYRTTFSLMQIHIKRFNQLKNTTEEHKLEGFLIALSIFLKQNLRESDILFRTKQNEFFIIMPHANTSKANALKTQLNKKMDKHDFSRELDVSCKSVQYRKLDTQDSILTRIKGFK